MTTREDILRAGARLRTLRQELHLTQQDVEQKTADRFGPESRVYAQQVSRIEKGAVDKPPILDLLRMGQVLGLNADDIAEMYDLWPVKQSQKLDPRLQQAINRAQELHGIEREQFLGWIQFAVLQSQVNNSAAVPVADQHLRKTPARR